ncbi:di-heme-cytochrome C peroxidase [Bradyrhizobium ganzhouense]|uniref:di-heme-cytochrome C peroxidase n=1 Tax=Bradyrhizobium ganzhouense TaxID=1179767 RepID=UPI003CF47A36
MKPTALARIALTSTTLTLISAAVHVPTTAFAQSEPVIYLNQAWSQDDRDWYYHFSQGSAVLSYDIFLNLEVAGGQELFRSDANSTRYGLLPAPASKYNPDALPIGVSKTTVATQVGAWPAGEYAGLTCAACHEDELHYKGKRIRIEGGINHAFDFQAYNRALDDALQSTLTDAAKIDRLAGRVGATSAEAKDRLRQRAQTEAARVHEYLTRSAATPYPWGPGRMDALTLIVNRVTAILPGIPQNSSIGIAPVKPPFLWNTPQGEWAQWAAFAQDPFGRNFGESVGVYLPIDLSSGTPAEGLFQSSAAISELARAENQLERLAPPSWPEEVFGRIDREKAKAGKALFTEHCSSCHNAWPYRWTEPNKYGKRFILVGLVPQTYVGTDTAQPEALRPLALTGELSKFFPPEFRGKEFLPPMVFWGLLQGAVVETAISKLNLSEEQKLNLHGYRELPPPPFPDHVWKAAPRDGVWATAPFLHNGSVPNLYEMLMPAAERTKKFWLGGDFNPVKVGLDTTATSGIFLMDTTLLGNSNQGHSFQNGPRGNGVVGPLLTDDQRWALVEYLKSIPEEPGRVAPFGGPPEKP